MGAVFPGSATIKANLSVTEGVSCKASSGDVSLTVTAPLMVGITLLVRSSLRTAAWRRFAAPSACITLLRTRMSALNRYRAPALRGANFPQDRAELELCAPVAALGCFRNERTASNSEQKNKSDPEKNAMPGT